MEQYSGSSITQLQYIMVSGFPQNCNMASQNDEILFEARFEDSFSDNSDGVSDEEVIYPWVINISNAFVF